MADKKKTDEKPLKLKASSRSKAKHSHGGLSCIIHDVKHTADKKVRPLSDVSFSKIEETVELRQKRANASERLDDICMEVPKTFYKNVHGAHRWC